jgi:hypothetical protein
MIGCRLQAVQTAMGVSWSAARSKTSNDCAAAVIWSMPNRLCCERLRQPAVRNRVGNIESNK